MPPKRRSPTQQHAAPPTGKGHPVPIRERVGGLYLHFHTSQDIVQTIAADHRGTTISSRLCAYDNNLFYKGFLLNEAQRMRKLKPDPCRPGKHLNCFLLPPPPYQEYTQPLADRQGTDELESQINELENAGYYTVGGFEDAVRQVNWQEVQRQLPPMGLPLSSPLSTNDGLPMIAFTTPPFCSISPGSVLNGYLFAKKQLTPCFIPAEGKAGRYQRAVRPRLGWRRPERLRCTASFGR